MDGLLKVAVVSVFTFGATNALAVSDTFNATLEIKQAISMTKTSDLDFGLITSDQATDVVVAKSDSGAAAFTINGGTGAVVDVAISNTNLVNGANTIPAEFSFDSNLTLTGGTAELKIGGTAKTAGATLVAGTYSANVPVDVTYQ
ncbi:DUF4402 domain-containing protein [Enterovibrio baiacu]|uniref:DUF4402 domain-containing protein n=1 Tax=Enterovibrio baiacu TaxID=2491023 RepID=UPI001012884B|nr:DUF4402 domain-containing protein [Enterovibrio baiacu]MBE1273939.1 hypothetical protein [Enterovibrio baiacu]